MPQHLCLYNEIDLYAAQWLRNLIAAGHIAPGVVDTRSISDLTAADLAGYTQVHFFAGIGGWSLGARLAGWPDDRPLWTGSCPCQPFSVAGKQAGQEDARHLWPTFAKLINQCRPDVVMGEQVAAAVGKSWLDGVCSDLESIGYACGAAVVPACAVDAPHRRDRLWFVADRNSQHDHGTGPLGSGWWSELADGCGGSGLAHAHEQGLERRVALQQRGDERAFRSHGVATGGRVLPNADNPRSPCAGSHQDVRDDESCYLDTEKIGRGFWSGSTLCCGADGKARRVKPGIRLLAHGIPARVGKLRAFGNAIVPQVAAEIIGAYLDCCPS